MAIVTMRIARPEHIRITTTHHPFAVSWKITALMAIAALVVTNHTSATKLPAVSFLIPVARLSLVPLVALRATPLRMVMIPIPMSPLSLVPVIVIVMLSVHSVMFVLRYLITRANLPSDI
jgi:hypothetical protein